MEVAWCVTLVVVWLLMVICPKPARTVVKKHSSRDITLSYEDREGWKERQEKRKLEVKI